MESKKEVYPTELRDYSQKVSQSSSGVYLEAPLSEKIINKLSEQDLISGDDQDLWLSLESGEQKYFQVYFDEIDTRHDLTLKHHGDLSPEYAVTIPAEFVESYYRSPFLGVSPGYEVVVEVDYEEPCLRIFSDSDYQERIEELTSSEGAPSIRAPVGGLIGAFAASKTSSTGSSEIGEVADSVGSDRFSLASSNRSYEVGEVADSVGSDRFRLKPFLGINQDFVDYVVNHTNYSREVGDVTKISVAALDDFGDKFQANFRSIDVTVENNSGLFNFSRSETVFNRHYQATELATAGVVLDIPKDGVYKVTLEGGRARSEALIGWDNILDCWDVYIGRGSNITAQASADEEIELYLPVPDSTESIEESSGMFASSSLLDDVDRKVEWVGAIQIR